MVKCSESESSYMAGCRCDLCRKAHTDRERDRRMARRKSPVMEEKEDTKKRTYKPLQHDTLTLKELRRARGWDD